MNDLRVILLVIGIALIACIYLWETLKQKRNLRSRVENYPAPARKAPRLEPAAENNSGGDQEPAYFNLLLNQDRTPAAGPSAVNLEAIPGVVANPDRSDETATGGEAGKPGREAAQEIMVIYILADEHPYFKGPEILKAAAAAEMKYGNMRVFHYHGPDRKHSRRPLFSLANITEPGYFIMDDMQNFTTTGLALFMCLPAEMGGDIAFEFMLDAANSLARALGGRLHGVDREQLDEDATDKMRAIANLY